MDENGWASNVRALSYAGHLAWCTHCFLLDSKSCIASLIKTWSQVIELWSLFGCSIDIQFYCRGLQPHNLQSFSGAIIQGKETICFEYNDVGCSYRLFALANDANLITTVGLAAQTTFWLAHTLQLAAFASSWVWAFSSSTVSR